LRRIGIGAEAVEKPALPALLEQLDLGDVVDRPLPGQQDPDHERVEEAAVIGRDDQAPIDPGVLAAEPVEAEPDQHRRLQDQPGEEVDDPVDPLAASEVVVGGDPLLADPLRRPRVRRTAWLLDRGLVPALGPSGISLVCHREAVPPRVRPVTDLS
jgi:hypothetical protein